jgi:hypothetical protein
MPCIALDQNLKAEGKCCVSPAASPSMPSARHVYGLRNLILDEQDEVEKVMF